MKILVFHQPYPMGNYKLNEIVADHLKERGHDVYLLQQLNGAQATQEYKEQIHQMNFDAVYFEMLDWETFSIVEEMKCKRVLVHASGGVLGEYNKIFDYYGKWYDAVMTNSVMMYNEFKKRNIPSQHFEFYHSVIKDRTVKQEYQYDCVFLGMGHNRLVDEQYKDERTIFFNFQDEFNFGVYGIGWDGFVHWKGLLPPEDIGSLYSSTKSAVGIIAKGQREHGMINNRYTEVAMCECPLISFPYPTIDWYGAEKYINFVNSRQEFVETVKNIQRGEQQVEFRKFMENKDKEFYQKLESLLGE